MRRRGGPARQTSPGRRAAMSPGGPHRYAHPQRRASANRTLSRWRSLGLQPRRRFRTRGILSGRACTSPLPMRLCQSLSQRPGLRSSAPHDHSSGRMVKSVRTVRASRASQSQGWPPARQPADGSSKAMRTDSGLPASAQSIGSEGQSVWQLLPRSRGKSNKHMKRTTLMVDMSVLTEAARVLGTRTYSATVNLALKEALRMRRIQGLADHVGRVEWIGELSGMRGDSPR